MHQLSTTITTLTLIATTFLLIPLENAYGEPNKEKIIERVKGIDFESFISLLYTESTEEYKFANGHEDALKEAWEKQTAIDWNRAEELERSSGLFTS